MSKIFTATLMGAQYYIGLSYAKPNDPIKVIYDPFGQTMKVKHSDPTALAVIDSTGRQLGYLPKTWSSLLGPYVRDKHVTIKGAIKFMGGPNNTIISCNVNEFSEV